MTDIKQVLIAETDKKVRLDTYLADNLDGWTRSQIKKQIDEDRVLVNSKPVKAGFNLTNGDIISLDLIASVDLDNVEPEDIPLEVVYEDDDVLVINKPQGMVVHPAPGSPNHTLVNALLYRSKNLSKVGEAFRPGIVHRIDKMTCGLIVVAKNNEAHFDLAKQIATHDCARTYIALCDGQFRDLSGTIIKPIGRSKTDYKKMAIDESGKYAETHYKVLALFDKYSLVEFNLKTGRTHQIRVHAKSIGHPIVCDTVYGKAKPDFDLPGQFLCAVKIKFKHPSTKQDMEFSCKIPDNFKKIIKKLKPTWVENVDTLSNFE
ncbi:MAG: RluA family pseudouridine synthase [bacterium]|nr:RluA family pseudouridine synthase [bacterium]